MYCIKNNNQIFCQEDKEITDYDDVSDDIINESVENNNNDLNTNNFEDTNIIFELEENMETIDLTEDFQGVIKNLKRVIRMIKNSSVKKKHFTSIFQCTRDQDIAFDARYYNSVEFIDNSAQTILGNKGSWR